MTHKVAILKTFGHYYAQEYDYCELIKTISEWAEVNDEDFKILQRGLDNKTYLLLEQPTNQEEIIQHTVAFTLDWLKREERRVEREREKKAAADAKRRIERKAKTRAQKEKLLVELKRELYGDGQPTEAPVSQV